VVKNILLLGVNQCINIVAPLIILPMLAYKLSQEYFGYYAQLISLLQVFTLVIDLGFNLTVIRDGSECHNKPELFKEYVSDIFSKKILTTILLFPVYAVVVGFILPKDNFSISIASYMLVVGSSLMPLWYYQITNKLISIVVAQVLSRLATVLVVWLFVSADDQYYILMLSTSVPALFVGLAFFVYLNFKLKLSVLKYFRVDNIINHYKDNGSLFWAMIFMAFYNTANSFVLSLILPPAEVAKYFIVEKIIRGIQSIYGVISTVLYMKATRLGRNFDELIKFNKKILSGFVPLGILVTLVIYVSADYIIVKFFGQKYLEATPLLQIFGLLAPIIVISNALGVQIMIPLGLDKLFRNAVIFGAIFNMVVLPYMAGEFQSSGAVVANLMVELLVLLVMAYYLSRGKYVFKKN
jgi:PST family polysaccharide transporter